MADDAAPTPNTTAPATTPTPPKPDTAPAAPATVRLAVPWPHAAFDPSLDKPNDKLLITAAGTDVPADVVEQVQAKWAAAFPTTDGTIGGLPDTSTVPALTVIKEK